MEEATLEDGAEMDERTSSVLIWSSEGFWERPGRKAVLGEETLSSQLQHQHFRQFCYQKAEQPQEVCNKFHHLGHQRLKPVRLMAQQILNLVVLEPFLVILPPVMGSWVRECGAEPSSQVVAPTEGLPLSQKEKDRRSDEKQQVRENSLLVVSKD